MKTDMPEVIWVTPLGGLSADSEAHSSERGGDFQSYTRTDIVEDLTKQLAEANALITDAVFGLYGGGRADVYEKLNAYMVKAKLGEIEQ
jgi:hypothetical protein